MCVKWNYREKFGTGYLKFCDFKKFIDKYPNFKHVELAGKGEVFLNPELNKIIEYAYKNGVGLSACTGVNLNTVGEETIEYLAKYKFGTIVVSIDGATNDTYSIYRIGGNFDGVIGNIKKINYYKQKYNTKYPELVWKFIIFGHNEHEIPEARKMAKELGMGFTTMWNCNSSYSPVKNSEFVKAQCKYSSRQDYESSEKTYSCSHSCEQLWKSPQINWDGMLQGCAYTSYPFLYPVNVFEIGLEKSLKNEKFVYAKEMLLGRISAVEGVPCSNCDVYKWRRDNRRFLNQWDMVCLPRIANFVPSKVRSVIHNIVPSGARHFLRKVIKKAMRD